MNLTELLKKANKSEILSDKVMLGRIIHVIHNPDASVMELKKTIDMDPSLTANILKRANSAYYGISRKVSDIMDAIILIGLDGIRELALNQKVFEMFKRKTQRSTGYHRSSLWIHCVGIALCGKMLYRRELKKPGHDIYTAGLLHDIGIIVLEQFLNGDFPKIIETVTNGIANQKTAERNLLGFSHDEVGQKLLENWNFPEFICAAAGAAENPEEFPQRNAMADALYISHYACQKRGIGYVEIPFIDEEIYQRCLDRLYLNEQSVDVLMDDVALKIQRMNQDGWFNHHE
ncbi:MAG: HDOD domain-containing protein [Deltaproteobacteria bacterium]|nr:HDOD domain-containing protein [Deltaproteobacteria bacterium]